MPTRNFDLTGELDNFLPEEVDGNYYPSPSEMPGSSVRVPESREKLAALRAALDEGLASGVYEGDVFAEIRAELWSESETSDEDAID